MIKKLSQKTIRHSCKCADVELSFETLEDRDMLSGGSVSNLIQNGDFELGNTGFNSEYTYSPNSLNPAQSYTVLDNVAELHSGAASYGDHTKGFGLMMAANGAVVQNTVVWTQTVDVTQNHDYSFSTWVSTWTESSPANLEFRINGAVIGSFTAPVTTGVWEKFDATWNSGDETTASIEIVNNNLANNGNDFALDDIWFVESVMPIRILTGEVAKPIPGTSPPEFERHAVSLERVDSQTLPLDAAIPVWVLIHGRNSSAETDFITELRDAVIDDRAGENDHQVVMLDWEGAAGSNGLLDFENEDFIPIVAQWASQALRSYGFSASSIKLIGHSWGALVAEEIAERTTENVNSLVALDPAQDPPWPLLGTPYDPDDAKFGDHSQFSWAFYSTTGGLEGNEQTPRTAHEAFVVENTSHNNIVRVFANMVNQSGNYDVYRHFTLSRLSDADVGPWLPNQLDFDGEIVGSTGGYEAKLTAEAAGVIAESIYYLNDPGALYISGTSGDDSFNFDATTLTISINGVVYDFGSVSEFEFSGGAGADFIRLTGSDLDEVANLGPGWATISNSQVSAMANGVEMTSVVGASGNDTVYLNDSPGDDQFYASPTVAQMSGSWYFNFTSGFESSFAFSNAGGVVDEAVFIDSSGDDQFYASPTVAQMSGAGYFNFATGFDQSLAFATEGGDNDQAVFVDSSGDDQYYAAPTIAQMSGIGYLNYSTGFDVTIAFATAGGLDDVATFIDSSGNDEFYSTPLFAQMKGTGFFHYATGFDRSAAFARNGGADDRAVFVDSGGDDNFYATPNTAHMSGTGFSNYSSGFRYVYAFATNGGFDRATLIDSENDDLFYGRSDSGLMRDGLYQNYVSSFDHVTIDGQNGGLNIADVAMLLYELDQIGEWI